MFYLCSKLSFKSSRISVAIFFCRRLAGAKVLARLVGLWVFEAQTLWCQAWRLRVIQQHLLGSRVLLPLLCPFIFDSSVLCKFPSFQCVLSETYCNKEENL